MSVFMGLNIMFKNCQGIRPKRKELELYLKENNFDIVALNETFLTKKINFKIPGYDTIKNDHSTRVRGGVAFLVKHGLVVNKEYRNTDFNIITDNEAFAIDIDLSNNQNLILAFNLMVAFTAQMEILTLGFSKPSKTFPTMSCLSAILIQNWKLSAVSKKQIWSNAKKYSKSIKFNLFKY